MVSARFDGDSSTFLGFSSLWVIEVSLESKE